MPVAPQPSPRMGPTLAQTAFVILASLFVYGFVAVSKEGEVRRVCTVPCLLRPDYMAAERRAPDFALKDMSGNTVTLESLRGKVVVLNFWSKTCGPCLEEMPDLAELTKIVRERTDVVVLAVSVDEGPDDIRPTLQTVLREEPPFRVLFRPRVASGRQQIRDAPLSGDLVHRQARCNPRALRRRPRMEHVFDDQLHRRPLAGRLLRGEDEPTLGNARARSAKR